MLSSTKQKTMNDINFGVEIEFTGIHRREVAELISNYFKTTSIKKAASYEIEDEGGRKWKIVRDNSIRVESNKYMYGVDMYKNELVTPIVNINDLDDLRNIINNIKEEGGIVNDSCGLHVHVGAEIQDIESIRRLLIFWITHQGIFTEYFKTNQRSIEKYCKLIKKEMKENLIGKREITKEEFKEMWYRGYDDKPTRYNKSRYQSLNMNTLYTIGTIEYRIGRGSLDYEYIDEYIMLCLHISLKAILDECMETKEFEDMEQIWRYLKS